MLTALLLPQANTTPQEEVSPERPDLPGKKGNSGGQSAPLTLQSLCGTSYSDIAPERLRGNL